MKKWMAVLLGVILVLGMTACGKAKTDGEAKDSATNGNQTNNTETVDSKSNIPTSQEMIRKATEASKSLTSFSMDSNVKQHIVMAQGDQKQEQNVDMNMKIDVVKEPLAMYYKMKLSMGDQVQQDIEQYITSNGVYSNAGGTWAKLPDENKDMLLEQLEQSSSPEQQLEQFESIAEQAKVTQEGNEYVLSADLSGDGVKELAKSMLNKAGNNEMAAQMLENMKIENIKIAYSVNAETFLPTKSTVQMTMGYEAEGQSISLEMNMTGEISKYNEIAKIVVPQEVLDSTK